MKVTKLKRQVWRKDQELKRFKLQIKDMKKNLLNTIYYENKIDPLSKKTKAFLEMQVHHLGKRPRARRFTLEQRNFVVIVL